MGRDDDDSTATLWDFRRKNKYTEFETYTTPTVLYINNK